MIVAILVFTIVNTLLLAYIIRRQGYSHTALGNNQKKMWKRLEVIMENQRKG